MLLIQAHAGIQQGGKPIGFPGPFLLRQVMGSTYAPTRPSGKAEELQGDGGLVEINTHNVPPQKRARGRTSGILKAKRSPAGTRHKDPRSGTCWFTGGGGTRSGWEADLGRGECSMRKRRTASTARR